MKTSEDFHFLVSEPLFIPLEIMVYSIEIGLIILA